MGKAKSTRASRPKKRHFSGNRFTKVEKKESQNEEPLEKVPKLDIPTKTESASQSKLKFTERLEFDQDEELTGFRFIDIELLCTFLGQFNCPLCGSKSFGNAIDASLINFTEKKVGLASILTITCDNCNDDIGFVSSKKPVRGCYDVNRRFPLAMCAIGRNLQQGNRFLANMNMPAAQAPVLWNKHLKKIHAATETVQQKSIARAMVELRGTTPDGEPVLITVSCDGTWQKRGFSSKNGVATVLSVNGQNSKVVGTQALSNYCNSCAIMRKKLTPDAFQLWKASHNNCAQNYTGSAGGMECKGMITVFRRSLEYNLVYANYLGDGDSKSYASVSQAEPPIYPNHNIAKLECTGHIQKRMGKRLMAKVKECKGKSYEDRGRKYTGIGGAGRLTQKQINKIQGHYGAAIRGNKGDSAAMRRAIMAILNHRNQDHSGCGNWCPAVKGTGNGNANAFPQFVIDAITPIFLALSDDTLLKKCEHGGTQNNNECFHNLIWERCPKTSFCGRIRLEIAVYDATIVYNDGELGRLDVFRKLNIVPGYYTYLGLQQLDKKRIQTAYVPNAENLERRRQRGLIHANQRNDPNYGAGDH